MKTKLLFIAGLLSSMSVFAQDPLLDSWKYNDGTLASYNYYPNPMSPTNPQFVQMTDSADVLEVCYNSNYVYVRAQGLADYTMGPWPGNPNTPSGQNFVWMIKRNAQQETNSPVPQPVTGPIGVALNGVCFFGCGDARSYNPSTGVNDGQGNNVWHGDAWASEGTTMDASGNGHPQQQGVYHYHACPSTLYSDPSSSHSPILGWAFDGYPIYGPFGYTNPTDANSGVTRMTSGYALRTGMTDRTTLPDGTVLSASDYGPAVTTGGSFDLGTYWEDYKYDVANGTLDEHNGRYCVTPEYPSGTYAYFIATDGTGKPAYPYLVGETYYGAVTPSEIQNGSHATIPSGVTCKTNNTTSIEEFTANEVELYPNPASGSFTISTNKMATEITVLSMDGKIIAKWQPFSTLSQVDISSYTEGMYIVRILTNNKVETKTLIVNK